jgi:hypothetical protein
MIATIGAGDFDATDDGDNGTYLWWGGIDTLANSLFMKLMKAC